MENTRICCALSSMGFMDLFGGACRRRAVFAVKVYKNKLPSSNYGDLFYNFAMGLFSAMLFAVVCLGKVGFTAFSFWLAAGVALCSTLYTLCGLKAVTYGKLAVFTAFLMLGGMIFPTVYGVWFLKEQMSAFKIAGVVLLIASMIFSATEKTEEKKNTAVFYILCLIAFVSNGFVSIFSKAHQIGEGALNTFQFSFWQSAIIAVVVGVLLAVNVLCNRKRRIFSAYPKSVSAKSLGLIALDRHHAGSVLLLLAINGARVVSVSPRRAFPYSSRRSWAGCFRKISKISVCILADIVAVVLMVF
ncbi:MAG: hypothetical protein ACLRTQ_11290 [Candidatus Borkfalkia sp.]